MRSFKRKAASRQPRRRALAPPEPQPAPSYQFQARRSRADQAAETARLQRGSFWRFLLQRTGLLIALCVVLVAVVSLLSLSAQANIKLVTSTGGSVSFLRNQSEYQTKANQLLASSIWNRNKLTIDTGRFDHQMESSFPELSSVSVALPLFGHKPSVYVEPAKPALILITGNGSFVVDTTGKALLSSADMASTKDLPQVADQSGLPVQLNHQALTSDDVNFIQTVMAELNAKHVKASSITLPASSRELDVAIAGQPYYVKFNLEAGPKDARQQVGTYLAAVAQLQRQHATPSKYVDVRVDGRAYYQ